MKDRNTVKIDKSIYMEYGSQSHIEVCIPKMKESIIMSLERNECVFLLFFASYYHGKVV